MQQDADTKNSTKCTTEWLKKRRIKVLHRHFSMACLYIVKKSGTKQKETIEVMHKWLTWVNAAKGAFSVFYNIWCCNFLDYVLICKSLQLKSPVVHQYVYIDKSPIIKHNFFLLQHRVIYPGQTSGMKRERFLVYVWGYAADSISDCRLHL